MPTSRGPTEGACDGRRGEWTECIEVVAGVVGARLRGATARASGEPAPVSRVVSDHLRPHAARGPASSQARFDVRRRLLYETDKQRHAGWRFIQHRVDITEFMVRLELACRGREDVGLLARKEILDDAPKTQRDRRVRLSAHVRIDGTLQQLSVVPDEMFGLRITGKAEASYFMFERDRGEMPVVRRKSKDQTYYAKKMLIYREANRQDVHSKELGIPNFPVATVTTTRDRLEQMIEAQKAMTGGRGSNMFLFADEATFAAGSSLEMEWVSGKGERIRLGD